MEQCAVVHSPMTKDMENKLGESELLGDVDQRKVRRAIAIVNYMAQDRPDLVSVSRSLSRTMASPTANTMVAVKRVIRYLRKYPSGFLQMEPSSNYDDDELHLHAWIDSDWAGDVVSRKSSSGGYVQLNGMTIAFWGKTQLSVALSSGEAELNSAVKGVSELIGFAELIQETLGRCCCIRLHTDASACKGMLLRQGCGKVKHLSSRQLWSQGAIESRGIEVVKIPRAQNGSDLMTHCSPGPVIRDQLSLIGFELRQCG